MKDKIIIEITGNGWEATLWVNDKKYVEINKLTSYGSKCISGDFESEEGIPEHISDSLSSSFFCYELARALSNGVIDDDND